MTLEELECLSRESVRGQGGRNLLDAATAKALSISHLFERRSVQRKLHAAGMLLRRGIGKVSLQYALDFADKEFIPVDDRLVTTAAVLEAERAMITMAICGQNAYQPIGRLIPWKITDPRVAADTGRSNAVHHVLEFL
jgi:hypothetical protein